jgi:hypothetical protein
VGDAPEGTIVRELHAFVDVFDALWVACEADDGEVWIRVHAPAPLGTALTPVWEQAVPLPAAQEAPVRTTATGSPVAGAAEQAEASATPALPEPVHRYDIRPMDPRLFPLRHSLGQLTTDAALIQQYMADATTQQQHSRNQPPAAAAALASAANAARDWNTEFQRLLETLLYDKATPLDPTRGAVHQFFTDFAQEVSSTIETIVEEIATPQSERTVRAFIGNGGAATGGSAAASRGVYFHNGVMYRLNLDTAGGALGGDVNAGKVASQMLRAVGYFATAGPRHLLHHPLVLVASHRGFSVTAQTIPPIDTLVAGSTDGGRTFRQPTGLVGELIAECFEELGCKEHALLDAGAAGAATSRRPQSAAEDAASMVKTFMPSDAAVYLGRDRRLYAMNLGRLLPPTAPPASYHGYTAATSGLSWRMRPEALDAVDVPLSSDAFVPGAASEVDNAEVIIATQHLRDNLIPTVAAVLGFHEPTVAPTEKLDACAGCREPQDGNLIFTICAGGCCKICPQCYLKVMKKGYWEDNEKDAVALAAGWVTCGTALRHLRSFLMTPDVTTVLHAHGVNLRYLNAVYQRIARTAAPCTGHLLEVEMIARAAKHLLRAKLRAAVGWDAVQEASAEFLVGLLQPSGAQAERFWGSQLGPAVQRQFDVATPFDTEALDSELVYSRLAELTGVHLTAESLASLKSDRPFVQLQPPRPVIKSVRLPHLVDEPGAQAAWLEERLERLRTYWDSVPGHTGWRESYPQYLTSKLPWDV